MRKNGVTEKRLQLLRDVSGTFRPGVLTALMGITGAGKTTLLDVLAGRKTGGYIEGTINISGYPKKQETFSRISGYCEQTDIHTPYLTVYESLQFSAYLRLPSEVNSDKRDVSTIFIFFLISNQQDPARVMAYDISSHDSDICRRSHGTDRAE
jgi:ABC-type multidrug transport system ATPase subunit